jgi:NADPH:quinone reductase-like Zn-dependent oxidoreductase
MKAIVYDGYGPPENLELREIEKPGVGDDGVLIRVRAAALNPLDWRVIRGEPYLVKVMNGFRAPKGQIPGVDVAGEVEEVGANVSELRPGDSVFGRADGSLAEYVCSGEDKLVPKPTELSWEQAAAIPVAGSTGLQAVRDAADLQPGQSILVNGAAGGVGTFAVQIAKERGGEVTGVCSTANLELVRSLGADHVVDYTVDDFTRNGRQHDVLVSICGNRSLGELRRALTSEGTLVYVGDGTGRNEKGDGLLGPLGTMIKGRIVSLGTRQRLPMFVTKRSKEDLVDLGELVVAGKLRPVIDRTYPLADAAEAMRHLETGHARGKVIVTVSPDLT